MRANCSALLKCGASLFAIAISFEISAAQAGALPGHGHFVDGQGIIGRSGGRLVVNQSSRTGIVNWKSFSVGRRNSIVFNNASGATLNIVKGAGLSRISGELSGTGAVYLINRSGVLVTGSGRIDTQGSFIASSRGADENSFGTGRRLRLSGPSKGNIINRGAITSGGSVTLYGDSTRAGTIAAEGNVETSGARVNLNDASVTAKQWLVDPKNLTITSSAASSIDSTLNHGTNLTLKTTASSCSGPGSCASGPGDIKINAGIAWNGTATLTLSAYRSIVVAKNITAKGKGKLSLATAHSGDLMFGPDATITFDNLASALTINGTTYTLENKISALATDIAAKPKGHYALAANINLGSKVYTAALLSPTNGPQSFKGVFEGLGHTISNLTIRDLANSYVGLFGYVAGGTLRDIGLTNANVSGLADSADVGALAGFSKASLIGAHASGKVLGSADFAVTGGLVGDLEAGSITNSYASDSVTAGDGGAPVGGLVGLADGNGGIAGSYATGNVTAGNNANGVGGLVGEYEAAGSISNSYATGRVVSDNASGVGGLVGYFDSLGDITSSHATGNVSGGSSNSGGLVGNIEDVGVVKASYATGDISSNNAFEGGLVGYIAGGTIQSSHASGSVDGGSASNGSGGLVGFSGGILIVSSYATGSVGAGENSLVGGLIGKSQDTTIKKSHASGNVATGDGVSVGSAKAGGLVGYEKGGAITNSYATGGVNGSVNAFAGGLVGEIDSNASVNASYATGEVFTGQSGYAGGLFAKLTSGTVTGSHATGDVAASGDNSLAGGLGGANYTTVSKSYATGDVNVNGVATSDAGGLMGYNDGTLNQTFATGAVSGGGVNVGGLVGNNIYMITNSYATGAVYGVHDSQVGGFAGINSGTIKTSYSTGSVNGDGSGGSHIGGFLGEESGGTYSDDYWNTTTSGSSDADGSGVLISVVGYTTSQFKGKSLSALGFSSSVWGKSASVNGDLPYLKAAPPP